MDAMKRSITLENLLTMSSGLETRDNPRKHGLQGVIEMRSSRDWTHYVLDRPMAAQPGTRFEYGNLVSFLLTSILHRQTEVDTMKFARENLFGPLGIEDVKWEKSPEGIYTGYGELWLRPLDMAKLGLLYLNKGRWDNQQIVSADWVEQATQSHISAGPSLGVWLSLVGSAEWLLFCAGLRRAVYFRYTRTEYGGRYSPAACRVTSLWTPYRVP